MQKNAMIDRGQTRSFSAGRLWLKLAPYVFISPFFILFATFGAFPVVFSLWVSLHEWAGLRTGEFVGLDNFARLVTDEDFHLAIVNTMIIGVVFVAIMLVLALVLAATLTKPELRFRSIYRLGFFLPVVTSLVVVGMLFQFFFDSPYSPVNGVLEQVGVRPRSWTGEVWFLKPGIITMTLWRWTGFNMIIMLAGLQTIRGEFYDAARVDGASPVQMFRYVTVPLMRPVLVFVTILSTIGTFNLFDEVYMLAGPGVHQAGLVASIFIYRTAFHIFQFGYASAISYAVAGIVVTLSLSQLLFAERRAVDQ